KGEQSVQMRCATIRKGKQSRSRQALAKIQTENIDAELLARLKAWRSAQARAQSVPPYVVFHDSTLAALAAARPQALGKLSSIPGLGVKKLERYGPALLELMRG